MAHGLPELKPAGEASWDALCLGLNALDRLLLVRGFPVRGKKARVLRQVVCGGGQAATAACCLARLGHRAAYAGVAGDDEAGRQAAPRLAAFGVDARGLVVKPGASSQEAHILVEADGGERTILWHRDEACALQPEDLDPELIAGCRVLHLDGHFGPASLAAASIAARHGAIVSMDAERVRPETAELLALCHLVVGDADFPQAFTGIADPDRALAALSLAGPAWVGRTLGPAGAEMYAGGRLHRQPGFAVTAVDTTGAGDVFHAGLVHAVLLGQGPQEALATACAAAAMSVTAMGGRNALPTRPELETFLASGAS